MDFLDTLREKNVERVEFFGHGGLFEENGWNLAEWGCALGGEAGELLNILKKFNRRAPFDPPPEQLKLLAKDEIGDIFIYLDLIAAKLELNLADCARHKFNRTSERYGYEQRIP